MVTMIASMLVAAFGSESIGTLFAQVLGVVILIAILAYLLIIPTLLILRYKYPAVPRGYRVPGGIGGSLDRDYLADSVCWHCLLLLADPERCLSQEQSPGSADV